MWQRISNFCEFPIFVFIAAILATVLNVPEVLAGNGMFAQGNLAVVFEPRVGRTSEANPLKYNLTGLWCQATDNGQDRLKIKHARFVRVKPLPLRTHEAKLNNEGDRAHLNFNETTPSMVGKYRCEITTDSDEYVTGNLFVYMRPIFYTNGTLRLDVIDEQNPFSYIGSSVKVTRGETAVLQCPAIGYPIPEVEWFKDNAPINKSAVVTKSASSEEDDSNSAEAAAPKFLTIGNRLYVNEAEDADEGVYRCVARNSFPPTVDGGHTADFELILEQYLRVSSSLTWLIPLIVIIITLIVLFIVIYACSAWKRYKSRQYNVAQKEKERGLPEKQQLNNDQDDAE